MGAPLFWIIQGISILGLVLSFASLGVCAVQEATGQAALPDVVFSLSAQQGRPTLWSFALEQAEAAIAREANITIDKPPQIKKPTLLDKKDPKKDKPKKKEKLKRNKRQAEVDLEKEIFERIPIQPQLYIGPDEASLDTCERNEILHVDGDCYEILSQGPCEDDEFVIINRETNKGICAPRLCSPDRVFSFKDQKCHDPFEKDICPPGRMLTTSCFGTPTCVCPDGTYEEEEDSEDEDACQPVLGKLENCDPGFVFWFDSFKSRPRCLTDPCSGLNAKKGLDEMAYAPSAFDGNCYQIGQEIPQCPSDTFYTLSFDSLKGICASLEEAGYLVLDSDIETYFSQLYGARIPQSIINRNTPSRINTNNQSNMKIDTETDLEKRKDSKLRVSNNKNKLKSKSKKKTEAETEVEIEEKEEKSEDKTKLSKKTKKSPSKSNGVKKGKSLDSSTPTSRLVQYLRRLAIYLAKNEKKVAAEKKAQRVAAKRLARKAKVEEEEEAETEAESENEQEEENEPKSRRKRDTLSYSSPSNVFEPSLAACKAGSIRGFNNKCRIRILPSRTPLSRPRRNVRVQPPIPTCPPNSFYSIRRVCVKNRGPIQANLLAQGLG